MLNMSYVVNELRRRPHRTLVNILGIAVGIALFVAINAVSDGYRKAASRPFENLGADLLVQRAEKYHQGHAPISMRGVQLPFSNQLIPAQDMTKLEHMNGVAASAGSLLLWEFTPGGFRTLLGLDFTQRDLGPGRVVRGLSLGRLPENTGEALVEKHYAKFHHLGLGAMVDLGGKPFTIVGQVEIKQGAQVASTNFYLRLEDARALAGAAPDALNQMALRLTDPAMLDEVKARINAEVPGAVVGSSDSFLELMGGVSLVSSRFAFIVSCVAFAATVLLIIKSMTASLVERTAEIGVLKTVGWTGRDVRTQLLAEALVQCLLGGLLGVALGFLGALALSKLSITMAVPWGLNPLPAMAKAEAQAAQTMLLPVAVSWRLAGIALALSVLSGVLAAWALARQTAGIKPAVTLRRL
ncbi:MAG: ABC transporter permease [Humidesulfovibrio sp.]|nr:ABC transporter permease [Humidesulfovibrio sp.]